MEVVPTRAAQQYIELQYSIAIYCIVVPKYCNILYSWSVVLQSIVLLIWSIAIYCIAEFKYCNVLYFWSEELQYVVRYYSTLEVRKLYSNIIVDCMLRVQYIVDNTINCPFKVLQYIVLSIWSIAIYCIAELKYCSILYCRSEVLEYIVLHIHDPTIQ